MTYLIALLVKTGCAPPREILEDFTGAASSLTDYNVLESSISIPNTMARPLAEWKEKKGLRL
jgi:hypothetical protein